MGGFKIPKRTARLVFTEESGYQGAEVVCSLDVSIEFVWEILEFAQTAGRMGEGEIPNVLSAFENFARAALIEWNLEDDDGNPIPTTPEGVKSLPMTFANTLLSQWLEAVTNPPNPLGGPSKNGSTSEALSPGSSKGQR